MQDGKWLTALLALSFLPILGSFAFGQTPLPNASASESICAPVAVGEGYITDAQLQKLRQISTSSPTAAPYAGLSPENVLVVRQALRIGQGGAFFAARLLRDLAIIDAMEQQVECSGSCTKPDIISHFKTGGSSDPNEGRSWADLVKLWSQFRDQDAKAGIGCMKVAEALPSRPEQTVAAATPKAVVADSVPISEPTPAVSTPKEAPKDSGEKVSPNKEPAQPKTQVATNTPEDGAHCRAKFDSLIAGRTITFAKESSTVNDRGMSLLKSASEILQSCGSLRVSVNGFTDSDGSKRFNQELSEKRASAVDKALADAGIDKGRVFAMGYGDSHPIKPNTNAARKAANRRVEISLK